MQTFRRFDRPSSWWAKARVARTPHVAADRMNDDVHPYRVPRHSYFDLVLYFLAFILLIPLVMRLTEAFLNAWDGGGP
jgi:hypothetical protein